MFAYKVFQKTSECAVPRARRTTAKLDVVHATAACIVGATHNLFELYKETQVKHGK